MKTVENDKVIYLDFVLKNEQGEVLDSSQNGEQLIYLHGANDIIPGLENALTGKTLGEEMQTVIPPSEAYGEYEVSLVDEVSREQFPGIEDLQPGMQFQTSMDDGAPMVIQITKVEGDKITVDGNHPLAGMTLLFDLKIADIRDATAEELEHGHVRVSDSCDV